MLIFSPRCYANDPDDKLHDDHARGANDQELTPSKSLDCPEGYRRAAHVDEGGNEGDEEGIVDRTKGFEKNCTKVEDKIYTRQLLHHLHQNALGSYLSAIALGRTGDIEEGELLTDYCASNIAVTDGD